MQDQSEGWIREASPAIDSKAVLQQLDKMLKSHHFRNSRRYPAFLAHIVRRRLEGDLDSLKERILGIEVFKRPHDYDTGADPVVRITAGEVRKRIALYYHDEGTEQELRIELPPGSYVPIFSEPTAYPSLSQEISAAPLEPRDGLLRVQSTVAEISEVPDATIGRKLWIATVCLVLALALGAVGLWYWSWSTSPLESLWGPFFSAPDPVLIVVGNPLGRLGPAENVTDPRLMTDSHSHVHMSFNDAVALTNITGLFNIHHQPYRIQTAAATSLDDLRKRPVVLISAFGNLWSGRILSQLRFSLLRQKIEEDGSTALGSVVDRRNPHSVWSFDFSKPVTMNSRDYAIVARVHSDLTEGPVTVVAGLGASATESASEFVSNPAYLQEIRSVAPRNWKGKNVELVLEIPVIDGKPGCAHIISSEFW